MSINRSPAPQGRYSRLSEAIAPGGAELPKTIRQGKVKRAAIEDPLAPLPLPGERRRRQLVAVNIHCDALETEHAYGRISRAAYDAGRRYQAILEVARGRSSGGCSFEAKDHGNAASAHEWAIVSGLERAEIAVALVVRTRRDLGQWAETLLSIVLGDGATLGQLAIACGYSSKHGRRVIAQQFRQALEDLADSWQRSCAPRIN